MTLRILIIDSRNSFSVRSTTRRSRSTSRVISVLLPSYFILFTSHSSGSNSLRPLPHHHEANPLPRMFSTPTHTDNTNITTWHQSFVNHSHWGQDKIIIGYLL